MAVAPLMAFFGLPEMPLGQPGWMFAVLMAVVLFAPIVAERARVPDIVGLVLAGMLVGPGVLGLLEREGAIELLGGAGLLYLMFVAGLELDLDGFLENRRDSLVFGAMTFAVPMVLGTVVAVALGFPMLAAILLASCWASHTLLSYPVYQRFGAVRTRSVSTTVGATIITDTAALLVLAVVARAHQGSLGASFWVIMAVSLAALLAVTLWVLPRVARWFFAGLGQDRAARFLFLMVAMFGASGLAKVSGIEAIVGAFLAGLALNRLVPNEGVLMHRIEFLGSTLLIPLFLVSVGMLIDPRIMVTDPRSLGVAAAFVAVALGAKWLASVGSGKLFGYERAEIATMFSLSSAQAAATLAAVFVGLQVGLIGTDTVNAVIVVILVTCLVSSGVAARYAPRLPRPPARRATLGRTVLVPVAHPASAERLARLAAVIARADGGSVVALAVVGPDATEEDLAERHSLVERTQAVALSAGAEAEGTVRIDASPAEGILHTAVEHSASLIVLGWKGYRSTREHLFGSSIDPVLDRTPAPVVITRMTGEPIARILFVVSGPSLEPAGQPTQALAAGMVRRLQAAAAAPVLVVTDVEDEHVAALAAELPGAALHHDPRKPALTIREMAGPADLVVVPASPGPQALRGAATRVARAAPDSSLLVVLGAVGPAAKPSSQDWGLRADDPHPTFGADR